MIFLFFIFLFIHSVQSFTTSIVDFMLGSTKVQIVTDTYAKKAGATFCSTELAFLNLHANEFTSVVAARKLLDQEPCGGRITRIAHGSSLQRNVRFTLNGQIHSFDPNRIFVSVIDLKKTKTTKNRKTIAKSFILELFSLFIFEKN